MEIIPAIDLLGGDCVRLHQGDYDQVTLDGLVDITHRLNNLVARGMLS